MKKGFTLIELMIVIIIIGVLATIGIVQYQAAVEKSRGAEARSVLGYLRGACAPVWMNSGNTSDCDAGVLGLGTLPGNVPTACNVTNYFSYARTSGTGSQLVVTATRCTINGKDPQGKSAGTVNLTIDFSAGTDVFKGTGGF